MGWHIHYKDGKYQIWSTVVDDYLLKDWVSAEVIEQAYIEQATERAKASAKRSMERAREHYCSAHLPIRCDEPEKFIPVIPPLTDEDLEEGS